MQLVGMAQKPAHDFPFSKCLQLQF